MYLLTQSGRRFDFINPSSANIALEDILYALARLHRFSGYASFEFSVAQHAVAVSDYLERTGASHMLQLAGLLQSAHKAYLGEMSAPVSFHLRADSLQRHVQAVIAEAFGIDPELFYTPEVREAKSVALAAERRALLPPDDDNWECLQGVTGRMLARMPAPVVGCRPSEAALLYLNRYTQLRILTGINPNPDCV